MSAEEVRRLEDEVERLLVLNATLQARNDALRERLDEAQLRYIEASNPGIDMGEVRRLRAAQIDGYGAADV